MNVFVFLMIACSARIQVAAQPQNAKVYVTDYPPTKSVPPEIPLASGGPDLTTQVNYFAWNQYYVWVGAKGYETQIVPVRNEAKVGPIIGGLFVLFPFIWAVGPQEYPIQLALTPIEEPEPVMAIPEPVDPPADQVDEPQ